MSQELNLSTLVKTPAGEWIQLSDYLKGGEVFQSIEESDISVRLYPNDPNKRCCILVNKVNSKEEGQVILDDWMEKVQVLIQLRLEGQTILDKGVAKVEEIRQRPKVELPVRVPSGNYLLLSRYNEVWIDGNRLCAGIKDSYRTIANFETIDEGLLLRELWAGKIIEAKKTWLPAEQTPINDVEILEETPSGNWVMLSTYSEVRIAHSHRVYLYKDDGKNCTHVATGENDEEAKALAKEWAVKLIEARGRWCI